MHWHHAVAVLTAITALTAATYPAHAQNQDCAIYLMRIDGTEARRVAATPDHHDHTSPRWSHDGKQIAFDAVNNGNGQREIFIVGVDGNGLRNLGRNARPDWSPDDKQLAYEVYSSNAPAIYVQNVDGTSQEMVASGTSARWSPDGSQLAVTDHQNVRLVDLLTGQERELFAQPYEVIYAGYNWSPDGNLLAITAQTKTGGGGQRPLLLVNAREPNKAPQLVMLGGQGGYVSFSPDGKQLVFSDKFLIRTVELKGKITPRLIPGQKGRNKDPHWSPDGQWIVFSSDRHMHE